MVDIFLPGDYYAQPEMKFPVIYYLHGAGGDQNNGQLFASTYYYTHQEDSTITSPAAIVVAPDGDCEPYRGGYWVNSALYGNFEDYVIQDVIAFVESEFRVIAEKDFRFITGQSMGGYGTAYLSLKYPELFRGAGPGMAAHLSYPDEFMQTWVDTLQWENGSFHFSYSAGHLTRLFFTVCGAFSPNTQLEPEPIEMLFDTLGQVVDTVYEKWQPYIPCNLVKDLSPGDNLSFFLQCGTNDDYFCYPPYEEFSGILEERGIDYDEAYHDGGHDWDVETSMQMCAWLDSLISLSYTHLGTKEIMNGNLVPLNVYPNPFTNRVYVGVTTDSGGLLRLLDLSGRVLLEHLLSPAESGQRIPLNLEFLSNGVYILDFSDGVNFNRKKIIKQ
jgi:S-formylglutathione hydrolase FrmB